MNPILQLENGPVMGFETEHAYVFLGIPYGKAERFQAPQECAPWEEVLECLHFPPKCPQPDPEIGSFYDKEFASDPKFDVPMAEDCLYLNVWMPKFVQFEYNPVAVWIHGGAFRHGYASEMEFDGESYARRGIVFVSIQYRLNFFGFFGHPELRRRYGYCGNYGLMDQMAAIEWVRKNAIHFSGNPENITVFGQSAGGISTKCLVSSPFMRGRIHKAILQSCGGYQSALVREKEVALLEKLGEEYLQEKGWTLEEFINFPSDTLRNLADEFNDFAEAKTGIALMLGPVVDGKVLPATVDEQAERGNTLRIPYMIGATSHDIFVTEEGILDKEKNDLHVSGRNWCVLHEEQGLPCYHYYFKRKPLGDEAGAFHSAELWYVFGTLKRSWRPKTERDYELSEEMLDAWATFMKTGETGWKRCKKEHPEYKEFY